MYWGYEGVKKPRATPQSVMSFDIKLGYNYFEQFIASYVHVETQKSTFHFLYALLTRKNSHSGLKISRILPKKRLL